MLQPGLFDMENRLKSLSKFGDPLEKLKEVVNFEVFRAEIEEGLGFKDRSKGGRPPYDSILIFKILVLQSLYNLSDDQTEYQIKDRLSFMRFLDLALCQNIPDAKTIWLYRERLSQKGLIESLFSIFDQALKDQGYLAMSGQIVDATIVSAPRPRMTKAEKETIKKGDTPEDWKDHPSKLSQKDRDASGLLNIVKPRVKREKKSLILQRLIMGIKTIFLQIRGMDLCASSIQARRAAMMARSYPTF